MGRKQVLVVDGKGGGVGRAIVEALQGIDADVMVGGTNAVATSNMLRGGAADGATGENSIRLLAKQADVIVGSIAILKADAMLGEITPGMALAIGQSTAQKVLLPLQRCGLSVVGVVGQPPLKDLLQWLPAAVQHALAESHG